MRNQVLCVLYLKNNNIKIYILYLCNKQHYISNNTKILNCVVARPLFSFSQQQIQSLSNQG